MHHALHREERALWLRDEVIKLHLRIKKSVGGAIGPGLETLKRQNEKTLLYNGNDISTGIKPQTKLNNLGAERAGAGQDPQSGRRSTKL